MIYCDQDMCQSKLGKLMQAFRADRPNEWQMDEFIGMAERMNKEIEALRQAEKDAARYRWLRNQANKAIIRYPAAAMIDYDGTVLMRQPGIQHLLCGGELDNAIDEAMNA